MDKPCNQVCDTPKQRATTKTYERCAVVDGCYVQVVITEVTDTSGNLTRTIVGSDGAPLPADTKFFKCADPIQAVVCTKDNPTPTPITLEGQDCDGAANPATGNPGELMQVVQPVGQVFKVQLCNPPVDYEKTILCDKITGHKVAVITTFDGSAVPTVTFWDINAAAAWTGSPADLEACADTELESDALEMCDSGTAFFRWIVKQNGEPTGTYFDTDINGAPYVVSNPAAVTTGKCVPVTVCTPTISSAPADTLAGLLSGNSISIQKSNCCSLKVNTSAGSFIISKDVTGYSTGDFDCQVTVTSVEVLSGTCTLADVIVTTQKRA